MAKTSGDELFERYLAERGYEPGPHEPSLAAHGIEKRPDFLPRFGPMRIACEVEQFKAGASALERRLRSQRTVAASTGEVYGPIRNHIREAADQLKPLQALNVPLVVVLANPEGAIVDLSVTHVTAALYGNLGFAMQIDRTAGAAMNTRFELGRDGKVTNDHPYISAVALLRRREHRQDKIDEIAAAETGERAASDLAEASVQAARLLRRLNQIELPVGDYLYLDVIETMSASAMPVPLEWFAGEHDSRWRLGGGDCFERVRGPARRSSSRPHRFVAIAHEADRAISACLMNESATRVLHVRFGANGPRADVPCPPVWLQFARRRCSYGRFRNRRACILRPWRGLMVCAGWLRRGVTVRQRRLTLSRAVLVTMLAALCAATGGSAAGTENYSGRTAQHQNIKFSVSSQQVVGVTLKIEDTCPDGHTLIVTIGSSFFPPIAVSHSGDFAATVHPPGAPDQPTSIHGHISGAKVTGSVSDTSMSPSEMALCNGHTTFTASRPSMTGHTCGVYWRSFRDGDQRCPRTHGMLSDTYWTKLRWSSWNASGARGQGVEVHRRAICGGHPVRCRDESDPVRIHLTRTRTCGDGRSIYTRISMITSYSYTGRRITLRDAWSYHCQPSDAPKGFGAGGG